MGEAALVSAEPASTVVRVSGFRKQYRKHVAADGIDLEVRAGEIYGLIGPDGSGKSSLMKAIAGVLSFEAGEVEVFGIRIDSERSAERAKERIGFLPQGLGLNLYPELSIEENIDFFARLRLVPKQTLTERKERWLRLTRLAEFRGRAMKHLSGGMKQKLGLICALIHDPDFVILDEPTTGIDPVSRRDFWAMLAQLVQERGLTALVSTAYMDEAERFHRLSFLFEGRVLASGTPAEIQSRVRGSLVVVRAEPQWLAVARLKEAFVQVEAMGPEIRILADEEEAEAAVARVKESLENLSVRDLRVEEPEAEDTFVALLRRSGLVKQMPGVPIGAAGAPARDGFVIEAEGLTRDFGDFRAVDRVSFQVRQGEIFGLLGANGAGKTTVIKMLTGILPPTSGQGRVAGADMRKARGVIKQRIGYMSQLFSLYLDLSVVENMRLFASIYGLRNQEARTRIEEILELTGLHGFEGELVGRLPVGVRQRLALGCALLHRPRVLFLDEPTSGVDPLGRRRFWEILFHLSRREGVALLVTTHYMSEAEHCDHLALMFSGQVVADAPPGEMKRELEQEGRLLEVVTDSPGESLRLLARAGFSDAALFGTRIHVLCRDPEKNAEEIHRVLASAGVGLRAVRPHPLTMEDVFVYRVGSLERRKQQSRGESHA